MKKAVCLLVEDPDCFVFKGEPDSYVVVSRPTEPEVFGLPGGKEEKGETAEQAMVRECKEETGVELDISKLTRVYEGVCKGKGPEDTYMVTTFKTAQVWPWSSVCSEEGLHVRSLTSEQLCSPSYSPFADYHLRVFAALKQSESVPV